MNWTTENIPSQSGKTAIVTGANSGLGYYTALGLASKGCQVIMACRNLQKAEDAKAAILSEHPDAILEIMKLDLGDLSSVNQFARSFNEKHDQLDLLINNAGLMAIPYRKTKDGFEMQFGVNHLGHFALTSQLFESLKATPGARVVNVSSLAHNSGVIRFNDIHWEQGYSRWKAYGMSKLSNILFTYELADRVLDAGLGVRVLAAHPGYSDSKLLEKGPEMSGRKFTIRLIQSINRIFAQSTAMGALPTLYAATSPDAEQRGYYGPRGFAALRGYPEKVSPNQKRISKKDQVKLWELSEELTGVRFNVE